MNAMTFKELLKCSSYCNKLVFFLYLGVFPGRQVEENDPIAALGMAVLLCGFSEHDLLPLLGQSWGNTFYSEDNNVAATTSFTKSYNGMVPAPSGDIIKVT